MLTRAFRFIIASKVHTILCFLLVFIPSLALEFSATHRAFECVYHFMFAFLLDFENHHVSSVRHLVHATYVPNQ